MITNRLKRAAQAAVVGLLSLGIGLAAAPAADAAPTARISGSGSSWAGNALNQWVRESAGKGLKVDYSPVGSSRGRLEFATELTDFGVSEIPYNGETSDPMDNTKPDGKFSYGLIPAVAGGTAFMYNLSIGGRRINNLQMTQDTIARIFTGQITKWDDPAIKKSNPGLALPNQNISVVVRSEGSGATAQLTMYLKRQFPQHYKALCAKAGCNPNAATSNFPIKNMPNFVGQNGSIGVTNFVANTPGTINYDEYSYALSAKMPVVKVQNAAGFYVLPTANAVAVALTQAKINMDQKSTEYLTQDLRAVYPYKDPRSYPLSAYSYFILPYQAHGGFNNAKGASLAFFANHAVCAGQNQMGRLGYSPLPMNLALAAQQQILRIPGVDAETKASIAATAKSVAGSKNPCGNPTFKPGDSPNVNQLVLTAKFPAGCDAKCQAPWVGVKNSIGKGPAAKEPPNSKPGSGKANTQKGNKTSNQNTTTTDENPTDTGDTPVDNPAAEPGAADPADPAAPGDAGVCDPETGEGCDEATGGEEGGTASGEQNQASAVQPVQTTLSPDNTWGNQQTLMALAGVTLIALIAGPPMAANAMNKRRREEEEAL